MRTQWTKKYDSMVDDRESGFDPRSIKGEVVTLNGGFNDLSGLKERLRGKGQAEEWADLVVMAQAWHWAHPDYDEAIVSHLYYIELLDARSLMYSYIIPCLLSERDRFRDETGRRIGFHLEQREVSSRSN
jgi:hypothetical protein